MLLHFQSLKKRKWPYLAYFSSKWKNNTSLFSSTFKVGENKVVISVESQDLLSFGPQNKTEWALILNGSSNFQSVERAFDYY